VALKGKETKFYVAGGIKMFAFLCVAAGTVTGCGVCAFGMWAFLRGQSAAILVKNGGLPDMFPGREKDETESGASQSLAEQLEAMFKSERGE
jgi:hypothetical protein